jgi:hypothetical protein
MAIKRIIVLFVETPGKFITAKLSIRKPGSSSVLIICDLFHSHALFIYKSVNSFHHPSINNSVCKTLINRAKTICEVSNIDDELEHLRNVLKMNGYPRHFIDNAMKTPQSIYSRRLNISHLFVYHTLVRLHTKSKEF